MIRRGLLPSRKEKMTLLWLSLLRILSRNLIALKPSRRLFLLSTKTHTLELATLVGQLAVEKLIRILIHISINTSALCSATMELLIISQNSDRSLSMQELNSTLKLTPRWLLSSLRLNSVMMNLSLHMKESRKLSLISCKGTINCSSYYLKKLINNFV